jgi:hypothetical protein
LVFIGLLLSVLALFNLPGAAPYAFGKPYRVALAQSDSQSPSASLILNDERSKYPLGLNLELLEDPGEELTIDEVSSPEFDPQFVPSQVDVPNLGYTNNAYWARVHHNQTSQMEKIINPGTPTGARSNSSATRPRTSNPTFRWAATWRRQFNISPSSWQEAIRILKNAAIDTLAEAILSAYSGQSSLAPQEMKVLIRNKTGPHKNRQ